MSSDLVTWVSTQLNGSDLDDDVGLVVLTALESDHALDEFLSVGASADTAEPTSTEPASDPRGVFLKSITVEGFRGIGPATTIEFQPAPGLTIIAGRNGSGESSLAEAFELVLTGGTYRWKQKSAQWKEHWRNLHHPDPATITVQVVEENSGPITISTRWAIDAADVDDRLTRSQRHGQKQQDGLVSLGWSRSLERFRPILSYDELGGLLEGTPSELYDAIANVLGVGQLTDAVKRIQTRLKERKAPETAATKTRKSLFAAASALEDERATAAATLLRKTSPDVDALRGLATGVTTVDHGPMPSLRALANLSAPCSAEQATAAAARLRDAVGGLADAGAEAGRRRVARLEMQEQALAVHRDHGDMTCPVCHQGELDANWAETTRDFVAGERAALRALGEAQQSLAVALANARRILPSRPSTLNQPPLPELRPTLEAARTAWDDWVAAPAAELDARAALALATHLETQLDVLTISLEELRVAATAALNVRDDAWEPLAAEVAAWCQDWVAWLAAKPSVELLARAEAWLKDNDTHLKNERLEPIRSGARDAWAKLRQESNVELGNLTLEGSATRRRVRIDSTVDGAQTDGLAILSQGELHALALALFLPRATMAESPFRFLVLDDPVQAMDPAKVNGLVELLGELAKTRQVIVLSHDDRLPAAVRRSTVNARIVEVTRGKDSQVTITPADDPATRYLADAFALLKDEELPENTLRRTLPGLLRFAVESAARERFFTQRLQAGGNLLDVEAAWDAVTATRDRVSLAIYGEVKSLDNWAASPYRKFGLRNVGTAMHNGLKEGLDPIDAARDVERLVEDIRAGVK